MSGLADRPIGRTIRLRGDSVDIQGVDYGPNLKVYARNKVSIVLRSSGHRRWSGIGSTKYESPKLLVFQIIEEGEYEGGEWLKVEPLVELSQARARPA